MISTISAGWQKKWLAAVHYHGIPLTAEPPSATFNFCFAKGCNMCMKNTEE